MPTPAAHRLLWQDRQSNREALEALTRFGRVELDLAPNFHHALSSRLHPDEKAGARPAVINVRGDAELLRQAAGITGLAELAELADTVADAEGRVQLLSPGPKFIIILPKGVPPQ